MSTSAKLDIKSALKMTKSQIQDGLMFVGNKLADDARDLTPVDTGRAKGSVTWITDYSSGDMGSAAQDTDRLSKPSDGLTVRIGSAVHYFKYLEFGTAKMRRYAPLRVSVARNRRNVLKLMAKAGK